MANEIVSTITLDLDEYKKQLRQAKDEGAAAAETVGKGFIAAGAAVAVASVAVYEFYEFMKHATAASAEAETAINQFNGALASLGQYSEAASNHFLNYAEALSKSSSASDDAIVKNASLLVSIGRLSGEGLDRATKASLDLAAGMAGRVGLSDAFNIVAKAAEGNYGGLKKLGIQIVETGDRTRDFEQVMERLNSRFSGAAERQTKTYEGAIAQLANAFQKFSENMGNIVTRSPAVIALINLLTQVFGDLSEKVNEFVGGRDIIGNMVRGLVEFGSVIVKYVLPPLELLYNGLNFVISAMEKITLSTMPMGKSFSETMKEIGDSTKDLLDFKMTATFEEAINKTDDFVKGFSKRMRQINEPFNSASNDIDERLKQLLKSMNIMLNSTLTSIISHGVERMGEALVKGKFSFQEFKNFALNAIGDMSIKMGEAMIAQAIGFAALASLIANPFTAPFAAAAFGAALIALGGVLKAAAGSGASESASLIGASAGAPALASGISGSAEQNQLERQKTGTTVNVTVQGHVLDRRESGLAIAEIIQESFGSNGIVYATGNA